jgi:putative hydrolase of the HAD superfamily
MRSGQGPSPARCGDLTFECSFAPMFGRARPIPPRAVLLDAMGTLVTFEPPAPRLAERLGVPEHDAARAIRAEIAYYRAHLHLGADAAGLASVRIECARIVRDTLGITTDLPTVLAALLDAIRFVPYPDAAPALEALRAAGCRLVVVSNWDVSLHEVLDRTGLRALVDGAVASAEVGFAKPDGAIFALGLEAAGGVDPGDAWHVGDDVDADLGGALAAGIEGVLIDRDGTAGAPAARRIASLAELPGLVGAAGP